jgi:hypothetical protein
LDGIENDEKDHPTESGDRLSKQPDRPVDRLTRSWSAGEVLFRATAAGFQPYRLRGLHGTRSMTTFTPASLITQ